MDHRNHAQIEHELPGFTAFARTINKHRNTCRHRIQLFEQQSSLGNRIRPTVPRGHGKEKWAVPVHPI